MERNTAEETAAQTSQVADFYQQVDQDYLNALSYPTTLHAVILCDGSVAYLLANQLEELIGNYTEMDQITIDGPNATLSILSGSGINQLFALSLEYEPNGNIKAAEWKTTYHAPKRYNYKYDELNRITRALYSQKGGTPEQLALADDLFSVRNIQYDALGNIQRLNRDGITGCGEDLIKGKIDKLVYKYETDYPNLYVDNPDPKPFGRHHRPCRHRRLNGARLQSKRNHQCAN